MNVWKFAIWTAGGALIWNIILVGAGYLLGAHFARIDDYLGPIANASVAIMVVAYLWRLLTWKAEPEKKG